MVDPLDARQQVEAEQPGNAETDLGLAVAVGVVRLDLHGGAVAYRASTIAATSLAVQDMSCEWIAMDLRSTCQ
jgi:hypothetical protein